VLLDQKLNVFERGPGLVAIGSPRTGWWSKFIRRGQLTFSDGTVVYHGIRSRTARSSARSDARHRGN
jgi:hypothetical protein